VNLSFLINEGIIMSKASSLLLLGTALAFSLPSFVQVEAVNAQSTIVTCGSVPPGYVSVGNVYSPQCGTPFGQINAKVIQLPNPSGSTTTCYDGLVPPGYVIVGNKYNPACSLTFNSVQTNARVIQLPNSSGPTAICNNSFVPPGYATVGSTSSFECVGPNNITSESVRVIQLPNSSGPTVICNSVPLGYVIVGKAYSPECGTIASDGNNAILIQRL
jgi:predicted aconitase with swiveling domain